MKSFLTATAFATALAATPAIADTAPAPQMDVTVIQQDSAATTGGIFVPIFAIILLLLLHTGSGSEPVRVLRPA